MKRITFILTVFLLLGGILPASAQENAYMPFPDLINLNRGYQLSVTKLFKSYLDESGRFNLQLPQTTDSSGYGQTQEQTRAMAQKTGAPWYIRMDLNRLGEMVIVTTSLYKTSDGSKAWSDVLKAKNPEDLDPIMKKIAMTIGTEKKAVENQDIYTVTDYDTRELNRESANFNWGFAIGGSYPLAGLAHSVGSGFAIIGSYDTRKLIFDITGEAYFSKVDIYFTSIRVNFPFRPNRNTPFLGGGLAVGGIGNKKEESDSYGGTTSYSKTGGGLSLLAGGGYILNRNASVQLRLNLTASLALFDVSKPRNYLWGSSSDNPVKDLHNPVSVIGNIAIMF